MRRSQSSGQPPLRTHTAARLKIQQHCLAGSLLWVDSTTSGLIYTRQRGCQIFEQLLHINAYFCASLCKHGSKLISQCLTSFCCDLALLCQVNFVAYDYYGDIFSPDLPCLLYPTLYVFKTLARRYIVANDHHL